MRLEILYKYGGFYIDADSICIEPIDVFFWDKTAFATFENEDVRKGLIANGNMGFIPKHPLCRDLMNWILSEKSTIPIRDYRAWYSVGPNLLTRFLISGKYPDFTVFPSYMFLPVHFEGKPYLGHRKVYAHQLWGSNYQLYNSLDFSKIKLPDFLKTPDKFVSLIIVSCENTAESNIRECLESIKSQRGHFGIEVIWIHSGPSIEPLLESFQKTSRFIHLVYHRIFEKKDENFEIGRKLANSSLIFIMNPNDIMLPHRIQTQMDFLDKNPEINICGSNVQVFEIKNGKKNFIGESKKMEFENDETLINNPTICFRKDYLLKNEKIHILEDSLLLHRKFS
jgi:hypothetical protein